MAKFVTAFAPATIGNVGVGFDMLGLAIVGAGDRVSVRRRNRDGVVIAEIRGLDGEPDHQLATAANKNTATIAATEFWKEHGDEGGLEVFIDKGVPLRSGMGSSAASAVAGVVAANALLDSPLRQDELLPFAIRGEEYASKAQHGDNVAPSLIGGLVFCPPKLLPRTISIVTPPGISSVLLHPDLQIDTADARDHLERDCSIDQWVTQQGYLGGFIAACERGDLELMSKCLQDVIIEPQRSPSVPFFDSVKSAAMSNGAIGCSISGSGPSVFALCRDGDAPRISDAMVDACIRSGHKCQTWISPLATEGARVELSR